MKDSILVAGTVAPEGYEVVDYMYVDVHDKLIVLDEIAEWMGISYHEALELDSVCVICDKITVYPDMDYDDGDYPCPDGIDTASLHAQDVCDSTFQWDELDDDLPF